METAHDDAGPGPRLVELQIADEPAAWASAGFTVVDRTVRIGSVDIRLTGRDADDPAVRGITGWMLGGLTTEGDEIDGLPTDCRSEVATSTTDGDTSEGIGPAGSRQAGHGNGTVGLDHVVVLTPDLERTIAAVEATGLDLRRIRETQSYGSPMRQAFFRLGPTVLEVVSGDTGTGQPATDAPATWFGLAVDVDDLDQTAAVLGDGLGSIKVAVQDGRRIATFRHQHFDISVPIAAMDHHAGR